VSSLSSSLHTAVTALNAQSRAVASISNNLANSETIGYKTTHASFYSLVTGRSSQANFTGAGVIANPTQNIAKQGQIIGTENDTHLAIDGNGFFPVTTSSDSNVFAYTRAGDFNTNDDGYLVNTKGYYLQGWPTDKDGRVIGGTSAANFRAVNMNARSGAATPTSKLALQANLPADAKVGDSFETSIEIFDSLGVSHTLTLTFTRSSISSASAGTTSDWNVSITGLVLTSDGTTLSNGTDYAASPEALGTVSFDGDGLLSGLTDSTGTAVDNLSISISDWSTGASNSTIAYNAGTTGKTDGLTQYAADKTGDNKDPAIEVKKISQDGVRYGSFYSSTVGKDGTIYANFDNGISYAIYKIPLSAFTNANGLEAISGNAYLPTAESGAATYVEAGTAGSGKVFSGSLESSTVDTASEFSSLITAQQAYSAACEIVTSSQKMYEDIIGAKR